MTKRIIEQSIEEVATGTPIIEVVDVVNQTVEQPLVADGIKSALAHAAIIHGNISKTTRHDLVTNQSLEPQQKVPRTNPEADRLLILALAKQRRNKRRQL
jgi:hypothetical protein